MTNRIARGERNNNPGNIEKGLPWQGLAPEQPDARFCTFIAPKWGVRAIARILITYRDKHNIDTIRGIVNRWAPPGENDTGSYVAHVCSIAGVGPDEPVNVHLYRDCEPIVRGIVTHELGYQPYPQAVIDAGLALAGIEPQGKPLAKSRTLRGAKVAGAAGAVATAAGVAEITRTALPVVRDLADFARDNAGAFLIAVGLAAMAGVGYVVWARLDDRRRLAR